VVSVIVSLLLKSGHHGPFEARYGQHQRVDAMKKPKCAKGILRCSNLRLRCGQQAH
jgi:hypothetical protein